MITLKEAKNYLRVDYEEDDKLIQNLLFTSKQLVMDVGRMDESELAENEDTVRTAMLFALGYLYESRSNPDYQKLTMKFTVTIKSHCHMAVQMNTEILLLFMQRYIS